MGDRMVFTNGCFDILHAGHLHLLSGCAALGERVIVGVNSDASVKRLKGESRPVNSEQNRMHLLAANIFTDAVILFSEDTPENLIQAIKPDVLVKGGDWQKEKIVGAAFVESYGGRVVTIPYLEGYSTTSIIGKVQ
ncbi:MAG: D-glycero-beta-D-manno-heptose 1-phosphate adenylyltransferase [Chitinophagales bacterium]|nr:D-glycero-beta-D-manno-heptose 1-phosphate adenylyltransferase [Chitinophagales bacterium]